MAQVAFTVAAAADLEEIYAYSLERWGERQADIYLDDLRSGCDYAAAGAPSATRLAHRSDGLFKLRRGSHLIVFRPDERGALIVRVLHVRMDIGSELPEQFP